MADPTTGPTEARLLQEELADLRSFRLRADHVRWVTRGPESESFAAMVNQFSTEWDNWTEHVAHYLVGHGRPPDGRVSALTGESYRSWLPQEWLDVAEAGGWIVRELDVLSSWARSRSDEADEEGLVLIFSEIEQGLMQERDAFNQWCSTKA